MSYDVLFVGRYNTAQGIGAISAAFMRTVGGRLKCAFYDTKPCWSDYADFPANVDRLTEFPAPEIARATFYTDVLWNGFDDTTIEHLPRGGVNLAYTMFDSSRLPRRWVDICNQSFDAVVVPVKAVAEAYRSSGVWKPIFVLPVPMDLDCFPLQSREPALGEPFVFGCVAGYHKRKNHTLLVSAFIDAFGPADKSVELRIHSNLAFPGEFEELQRQVEALRAANIRLSCYNLSRAEYIGYLKGIDVFVQVSRGEGYSLPVREAMSLGKPCIISDNTAHQSIAESGLVCALPSTEMDVAIYDEISGFAGGCQFSPARDEVANALRACRGRDPLSGANERHEWVQQFSAARLEDKCISLFRPAEVILSANDDIKANSLLTTDPHLVAKYRRNTSRICAGPGADAKYKVFIAHDGGFFSVFNTFLSNLVWNLGKDGIRYVLPDWRVKKMKEFWGRDNFVSFCYGTEADGNIWLRLFEPVYDDLDPEIYQRDDLLYQNCAPFHSYNIENEPLLTWIDAYRLYQQPWFPEWRQWYNYYYSKYTRVKPSIQQKVDEVYLTSMKGFYCIGVHARHPGHAVEQPDGKMPFFENILHLIHATADACSGFREWRVFLATDQQKAVQYFRDALGDRVILVSDVARTTPEQDAEFEAFAPEQRPKEGFELQHRIAADQSKSSVRYAEEVLVDTMLLARCNSLLHTTSNVATAASFMNPSLHMVYCS